MLLLSKFTGTYSPHAARAGGETQLQHWGLLSSSREAAFVFQLYMHLLPIMLQSVNCILASIAVLRSLTGGQSFTSSDDGNLAFP